MVALIVMRYTKPNYPRPYKVSDDNDGLNSKCLLIKMYLNAAKGAHYHSICGFDHLHLPGRRAHHRYAADRVHVRPALYFSRPHILRAVR